LPIGRWSGGRAAAWPAASGEIARALVGRPRLLLLDEPAAGLSLAELDRLGELIAAIGALGTPW